MFNWEDGLKKLIVYLEQLCGDILLISPNDFSIKEFDNRQIMTIDILGKGIELHLAPLKQYSDKYGIVIEIEAYHNIREGVDIAAITAIGVKSVDSDEMLCYHEYKELALLLQSTTTKSNNFN